MVGEHASQTTLPESPLRPAWRAACAAYRDVRRAGAGDWPAWQAARDAVLKVHPELEEHAAGDVAGAAIAFASVHHPEWLWRGVGGR